MGLELKPSKTRITHTLDLVDGQVGFDFLGFHVRQHRVGHTRSAKATNGELLGFQTFIQASDDAQKRHLAALAEVIRRDRPAPQEVLVEHLNPKIWGWAAYHHTQPCSQVFSRLGNLLYQKLRRWARRRHPRKSAWWISRHYWHYIGRRNWVFRAYHGDALAKHTDTHREKHIKVAGARSPYDGDWTYWARRLGSYPTLSMRTATLLKRQDGKCARCGLYFRQEDLTEVDHVIPRSRGGIDGYVNWQLLHAHCHDQKTAADGSNRLRLSEVPTTRAKYPATRCTACHVQQNDS